MFKGMPINSCVLETQRAVSFFEVPSRSNDPSFLDNMTEVIPAGRGKRFFFMLLYSKLPHIWIRAAIDT